MAFKLMKDCDCGAPFGSDRWAGVHSSGCASHQRREAFTTRRGHRAEILAVIPPEKRPPTGDAIVALVHNGEEYAIESYQIDGSYFPPATPNDVFQRPMPGTCGLDLVNVERTPDEQHADANGGLSQRGVDLLGLGEPCRCGHPYALHDPVVWNDLKGPKPCVEPNCQCGDFKPVVT